MGKTRRRFDTTRGQPPLVGLLAALALVVAACGSPAGDEATTTVAAGEGTATTGGATTVPSEETTEPSGEAIELRFSWWGGDFRHEYTEEIIALYEEQNPNVDVVGEFTGWDEYWDRLATTVAAGDSPDVIQQEIRFVREYADRGQLLDLSQYADVLELESMDPQLLPTGQIDGAQYAIPTGGNIYSVVANPTLFEEAGVEMPDDTSWSWEDFVQTTAAISEASGEEIWGTQAPGYNEATLQVFARQRGQDLYEGESIGFDRQTLVDWFNLVAVQLLEAGSMPPASVSAEVQAAGVDGGLISTGAGATGLWWSNQLAGLSEAAGTPLQLLRFPGEGTETQPGMFFKPAMYYAIAADTPHPEEAVAFLAFLLNSSESIGLTQVDRGVPVNLDRRGEIAPDLSEVDQQVADFMADLSDEVAEPPGLYPVGAGEVQGIIERLNDEVLFGRMTPDEAADQFFQEAEAALGQ